MVIKSQLWLSQIGLAGLFLFAVASIAFLVYKSLGGKRTFLIPGLAGQTMDKLPVEVESLISNIQGGVVICLDDEDFTITYCSAGFYVLTGYSHTEFEYRLENKFVRLVHSEDVERVRYELSEKLTHSDTYSCEYRIRHKSGRVIWMLEQGKLLVNEDNERVIQCILTDVTEWKRRENELVYNKSWIETIANSINGGIVIAKFDEELPLVYANDGFLNLAGCTRRELTEELESKSLRLVMPEDKMRVIKDLNKQLSRGDSLVCEYRIQKTDGSIVWVLVKGQRIVERGEPLLCCVMVDITKSKETQRLLEYKASCDSLSGLYNKLTTEKLISDFLFSVDSNSFHALLLIDCDNFKRINDSFGHMYGDSVIVDISKKLTRIFRSSDIIGRVGGDEFMVFLKNPSDIQMVFHKAHEICAAFKTTYTEKNNEVTLGASIGISLFGHDGLTFQELYEKADTALYTVKDRGKNGYLLYGSDKITPC
ncbi:MAG: diguanylate cyclase [Spirochaetaceae bacterium]|nr:diguanylate cyclase [Spirochaetaceae bacterium]